MHVCICICIFLFQQLSKLPDCVAFQKATSFAVLGVACKVGTVAINLLVWSRHAPLAAQGPLLLCILASVAYVNHT